MNESQKLSPRFCRVSRKFMHSSAMNPKDFGVWLCWQITRCDHRRLKWHIRSRWIAPLLAFLIYSLDTYIPDTHPYFNPTAIILFAMICIYWITLMFWWGVRSQVRSWRRLFNIDTWAAATAFVAGMTIIFPRDFLQFEIPENPLELAILTACIYGWIFVRWGETEYFRRKLSDRFHKMELRWYDLNSILQVWKRFDLSLIVTGALLSTLIFVTQHTPSPLLMVAALFPIFLPYSQWIMTWTLYRADQNHFACSDFSFFRNLRKFKLFIFHQFGTLTEGNIKIEDYVIDPDDEWSKDEIKDILFRITENSTHPISLLIHNKFRSNKRSLVTLDKVTVRPHLGIQAEFKDLQGRATSGVLGGMTWHKVLQHEIFPETLARLKGWKEKRNKVVLLSLNRKILAMFAISDPMVEGWAQDIDSFKKSRLYPVLMSSNEDFLETAGDEPFLERAMNLVPVERIEQKRYWLEREAKAIEVVSYWDEMDEPQLPQIRFTPKRQFVSDEVSAFVAPRIDHLRQVICLSRAHHLTRYIVWISGLIATVVCAALIS